MFCLPNSLSFPMSCKTGAPMKTPDQILAEFEFTKRDFTPEQWARITGAMVAYREQFKRKKGSVGEVKVDECYQAYVDLWIKEYPALGFSGASGKMIKLIIAQGRKWIKAGGKDDTRERVIGLFGYVIAYVKQANHFCNNKPLTTWNGQYLSIIAEISSGKRGGKQLNKADETREFLNSIRGPR